MIDPRPCVRSLGAVPVLALAVGCAPATTVASLEPAAAPIGAAPAAPAPTMQVADTIRARPFDTGRMWTFDFPPLDYLQRTYNFVSTNDIIGGNSGSPVVNQNSEVVGLAFDGNLASLPGSFIFDETRNRTISVHSAGMLESLRSVYQTQQLVTELMSGRTAAPRPTAGR